MFVRLGGIIPQIQPTQYKDAEATDDNAKWTPFWHYGSIKIEVKPELRSLHSLPILLIHVFAMRRVSWDTLNILMTELVIS